MARLRSNTDLGLQLVWLVILVWFSLLTLQGSSFGQLGLGVLLFVGGIWGLARSQNIWDNYRTAWKKLPASQKNIWNKPKQAYYYLNVFVVLPLAIVLGLMMIIVTYIVGTR